MKDPWRIFAFVLLSVASYSQSFTTIDYPGAFWTGAEGINQYGDIVGNTLTGHGNHCFMISHLTGDYSLVPASLPTGYEDGCWSINAYREIAGALSVPNPPNGSTQTSVAMVYFVKANQMDVLQLPVTMLNSWATGINDNTQVVGFYSDSKGNHGFYENLVVGVSSFQIIDYPGLSGGTSLLGIGRNNFAGILDLSTTFIDSGGQFLNFSITGAQHTEIKGINSSGYTCGWFVDSSAEYHGFRIINGSFHQIDYPDAVGTLTDGINSRGDVVGYYYDQNDLAHGYVLWNGTPLW
jgi:uncharacterized membrane protein